MDRSAKSGWELLRNGEHIRKAEENGYEVMVRSGRNMRNQQNLVGNRLVFVVPITTVWPRVQHHSGRFALP